MEADEEALAVRVGHGAWCGEHFNRNPDEAPVLILRLLVVRLSA